MYIISRQTAITEELTCYFTGVPCKRGHLAERYTKCSACLDCLHPKFATSQRKWGMIRIGIVLDACNLDIFEQMAVAFAQAHEPSATIRDIRTRHKAKAMGHRYQYKFMCFREDVEALQQMEANLGVVQQMVK